MPANPSGHLHLCTRTAGGRSRGSSPGLGLLRRPLRGVPPNSPPRPRRPAHPREEQRLPRVAEAQQQHRLPAAPPALHEPPDHCGREEGAPKPTAPSASAARGPTLPGRAAGPLGGPGPGWGCLPGRPRLTQRDEDGDQRQEDGEDGGVGRPQLPSQGLQVRLQPPRHGRPRTRRRNARFRFRPRGLTGGARGLTGAVVPGGGCGRWGGGKGEGGDGRRLSPLPSTGSSVWDSKILRC